MYPQIKFVILQLNKEVFVHLSLVQYVAEIQMEM